jgi:hypothetical protein
MSFSKDSEDNSAQVSVKAKLMEVLDAIHSSPHSSPVPSGQVMSKEVVEAKFDALNSPLPVVAHLVSEQEDLDSLLHYVDAGVVSYLSHYDIMTHSHVHTCHHKISKAHRADKMTHYSTTASLTHFQRLLICNLFSQNTSSAHSSTLHYHSIFGHHRTS